MGLIGKIYNNNCSFNIEFVSADRKYDSPNYDECSDDSDDLSCEYLQRGSFIVNEQAQDAWFGFITTGGRSVSTQGNPNTGYIAEVEYSARELNIAFNLCVDDCDCWSERINCLLSNCCDDSGDTYLEYINDCGRMIRLKIIIGSTTYENLGDGCGIFNMQLFEASGATIEMSSNTLESYPTQVQKLTTINMCTDCADTCLVADVYNKTKEHQINAAKDKVLIVVDDPIETFTLFWNDSSAEIPLPRTATKPDTIEIFKGGVYLNNVKFLDLVDIGREFDISTTSNGEGEVGVITDTVKIETSGKSASAMVINFIDVEACSYPILGQPMQIELSGQETDDGRM